MSFYLGYFLKYAFSFWFDYDMSTCDFFVSVQPGFCSASWIGAVDTYSIVIYKKYMVGHSDHQSIFLIYIFGLHNGSSEFPKPLEFPEL